MSYETMARDPLAAHANRRGFYAVGSETFFAVDLRDIETADDFLRSQRRLRAKMADIFKMAEAAIKNGTNRHGQVRKG